MALTCDPLFQTAVRSAGRRVIGVILSGALDDGVAGMLDIKLGGGVTLVQDTDDALFSGMPRSVVEQMEVDRILPAAAIPAALAELAGHEVPDEPTPTAPEKDMTRSEGELDDASGRARRAGNTSRPRGT